MKRKKRDCNSKNDESFSEQHTPTEEANQQKPITGVERIADGSSCDNYDKRRKKNLEEENILGSGEIKKRKKAKDKVNPISNNTTDGGFVVVHKPAVTVEETVGDGNHKMRSSSLTRDEEKTRKRKKNKHWTAENQEFSVERISDKETTEEDKQTMDAGKISETSANEGTSSARNADNISASKTSKTKKREKKVSFSGNVEAFPSTSSAKSSDQSSGDGLLQGKRFSQEEDEMIRQAVFDYIKIGNLNLMAPCSKGFRMWKPILLCDRIPLKKFKRQSLVWEVLQLWNRTVFPQCFTRIFGIL